MCNNSGFCTSMETDMEPPRTSFPKCLGNAPCEEVFHSQRVLPGSFSISCEGLSRI